MSDEKSPGVMAMEAHEELVQRIESGQGRIRVLSIITVVVAFLLAASYFSQIVLAFVGGQSVQTVDLLNPGLIALEVALLVLSAAWLYVGVVNYVFASRLGRQVKEMREAERALEGRMAEKLRHPDAGPE